jgi:hypothetical protein
MFAVLNIFFIVLVLLIVILNVCSHVFRCFYKWCACCFKCCTCCCGPPRDPDAPKQVDDPNAKYTKMDYYRITSFLFVIIGIPIMCILSTVLGVQAGADNSSGVVNAPQGFANFAIDAEPVITRQMISQVGETLVPLFEGVNDTVNRAISIDDLNGAAVEFNLSLGDFPQIQTFIDIGFDIANLTTDASAPIIDGVVDFLIDLNTTANNITDINNELIADINTIAGQNNAMVVVLDQTNATVSDFKVVIVSILGDGGSNPGIISSAKSDLSALPTASVFDTAGTSVISLANGGEDGNSANIQSVADDCVVVYDLVLALPNYITTADNIDSLNATLRDLVADGGIFDQLIDEVDSIDGIVTGYPSLARVADVLQELKDVVLSVEITQIIDLLNQLLDLFNIAPEWMDEIHDEVALLKGLVNMGVNVTDAFTKQLITINSTLIGLSDDIMDLTNITNDEFSVSETQKQIDDILELIDDSKIEITGNVMSYVVFPLLHLLVIMHMLCSLFFRLAF